MINPVSEYDHQKTLFEWATIASCKHPHLDLMFAINNGLRLTIGQAMKAKRSGTRRGIPDIFLPCARGGFHGLFLEMKKEDGVLSKDQKDKIKRLTAEGYKCEVAYCFEEAKNKIVGYLGL